MKSDQIEQAEQTERKDVMTHAVGLIILVGFMWMAYAVLTKRVDLAENHAGLLVVGAFISGYSTVIGFYLGTSNEQRKQQIKEGS